jgi:uncharacterized membrane protein YpjA
VLFVIFCNEIIHALFYFYEATLQDTHWDIELFHSEKISASTAVTFMFMISKLHNFQAKDFWEFINALNNFYAI